MSLKFLLNKLKSENRVDKVIDEIKCLSAVESYKITLHPDENAGSLASALGGEAYLKKGDSRPVNKSGAPMPLLCRINLEDIGKKGILQFFISNDSSCEGCVKYYESLDENETVTDETAVMPSDGFSPVKQKCRLNFEKDEDYISVNDVHFESVLKQAVKNALKSEMTGDMYSFFNEEECKKICAALSGRGSKLFGYPCFTQCDFREENSDEILLLQIDSESRSGSDLTMWGDSGEGNFFINKASLEKNDFSSVSYCWDCY